MTRTMATLGCVLVALVLTACGGTAAPATPVPGSGTGGGPGPLSSTLLGQAAGPIDSCALLSDEEIEAATGERVSERRVSTLTQVFPSVCDILLENGGSLFVSVLSSGGRAMYETSFEPFIGQGETPPLDEAVPGLGDKAGRSGQGVLMVLKDDVLFDLQYIGGRPDRLAVVRYLAERILASLPCIATGCPQMTIPPVPTAGPATPGPTPRSIDPGGLPSTGAQARVVNLYSEDGQPVAVDVYAFAWSETEMTEVGALVASVPYGQASEWFNPGLVNSPFGGDPYTKVDIFRAGDQTTALGGTSEFLGSGTVTTIAIWQEEIFEGQPGALVQTIYAEHPDYAIPSARPGEALLLSRHAGLQAEEEPPILFASVGDGCLESPLGRTFDPEIPNAQPIGNDLVIPVGDHTLTVHEEPFGEVPTCDTKPLGPGAPVTVAAGDRLLAFPYRLSDAMEINLLVVPLDAP